MGGRGVRKVGRIWKYCSWNNGTIILYFMGYWKNGFISHLCYNSIVVFVVIGF
jgi:hypothetical protein